MPVLIVTATILVEERIIIFLQLYQRTLPQETAITIYSKFFYF